MTIKEKLNSKDARVLPIYLRIAIQEFFGSALGLAQFMNMRFHSVGLSKRERISNKAGVG